MIQKFRVRTLLSQELPFLFSLPARVWHFFFLIVPLFILFYVSVHAQGVFSLDYYRHLFNIIHIRVILRSLVFSLTTASLCLISSYPLAYFLAIKAGKWKNVLLLMLFVPLWTNFLIQIYGWSFLLERNGLINTIFMKLNIMSEPIHLANNVYAILLVMTYCYIPFMLMPLYTIIEKLDLKLLEASEDLGASSFQTFFNITLPISMNGIRTGFLLTFVLGFGEFAIQTLMGGGKYITVGSLIYYYALVVRDPGLTAAFTCLSCLVLLTVGGSIYRFLGVWCIADRN